MLPFKQPYEIAEYLALSGKNHYEKWFNNLDIHAATKISIALLKLAQGNISNVKWFKGIAEYKIDFGPGYRIYFGQDKNTLIILLNGGSKKTQMKDIQLALDLWGEYKTRKSYEEF